MRRVGLALLGAALELAPLVLVACAHTQRPPAGPPPPPPATLEICLDANPSPMLGSCGDVYTRDLDATYPCAMCRSDRGCLSALDFTYCVGELACDDPRCKAK